MLEGLVYAATLLFFVFDPFASLPIFISMTKDLDEKQKTMSANRAVLVAGLLFLIFALVGTELLKVFSVTLDGFRIAGGIVLLLLSIEIIFGLSLTRGTHADVAWVIVATPILTGPGVITTAILLMNRYDLPTVLLAGVFSLIITWILLRNAGRIIHVIGNQAIDIFSKIIGLLIAAMAVEFILRGALEYVHHFVYVVIP